MSNDFSTSVVVQNIDEDLLYDFGAMIKTAAMDRIIFRVRSELFEDMTNLDNVLKARMLHAFMTSNSFPDYEVSVSDSGQERTLRADGHWRPDGWRLYILTRREPTLDAGVITLPPAGPLRLE